MKIGELIPVAINFLMFFPDRGSDHEWEAPCEAKGQRPEAERGASHFYRYRDFRFLAWM